jgi:hypothetical protein
MTEQCFKKKDSDPPVCGVHNVPLAQWEELSDIAEPSPGLIIDYFECPTSHSLVLDVQGFRRLVE